MARGKTSQRVITQFKKLEEMKIEFEQRKKSEKFFNELSKWWAERKKVKNI